MADRKSFLLRIDKAVLEAAQRWANDDLRSLNAQIEFVLRDALRRAGRGSWPAGAAPPADQTAAGETAGPAGQSGPAAADEGAGEGD